MTRSFYGLGEFFAEIGGLWKALEMFFIYLTMMFGHNRLVGLLSNRLYENDPEEKTMIKELF